VLRTYSSEATAGSARAGGRAGSGGGGIPRVSPLWVPTEERFSAAAGMHRVVWLPVAPTRGAGGGAGGPFRRPPQLLVGTFTAKLTVNGQSYLQSFSVRADPRSRAQP